MSDETYDVVVIGTGPGGEGAAMQAVKLGKNVAAIERYHKIGGSCTHRGTIPSKALRHAIFQLTSLLHNKLFRQAGLTHIPDFPELRRSSASVIEKQVDMRLNFYERNGVPIYYGHARLIDPHTVEVVDQYGGRRRLKANCIVLSTGARPYRPRDIDFSHPNVFDSDTILDLSRTPRSVLIYGAGVIGCEYASMFRNLGVKVNLINSREKLLEFLDDEIIDALSYHLRDCGVLIRHRETYERVEPVDDGVVLHLKSGKQIKTDILFWAAGRVGNTENMGLTEIGVEVNDRQLIKINADFQTSIPHIYAVGDVIGVPSLASAAYVQGRYAAHHFIHGSCERAMVQDIPSGIYTSPEISSLGKSERELTAAGIPYEVGQSSFKHLARAQITGQTTGMLKLLFHRESLQVLGIHCFGANATEIIHIGQAIMAQPGEQNTLMYFVNQTFNYPTMAEAYRVAALNGLNRLF
ncbi:MAG TPA: Si-specific NAD(P)(+) transhydrogenase [Pirellulaceae bacterium]|jgi:NAD(P) transhydrogenase|nr:Si-specific NAD(P)(+) transhydrogenase [Pirellulaceae bacterium]